MLTNFAFGAYQVIELAVTAKIACFSVFELQKRSLILPFKREAH